MGSRVSLRRTTAAHQTAQCSSMNGITLPLCHFHPKKQWHEHNPRQEEEEEAEQKIDLTEKHTGSGELGRRKSTRKSWKILRLRHMWESFLCMIRGRTDSLIR